MTKTKVLIVDDEEGFCWMIKKRLEDTGKYDVYTESFSSRTVSMAKEVNPDAIILDFMMPDMDGDEVVERLREDQSTESIPVIFLTAIAMKEGKEDSRVITTGSNVVLGKPVSSALLMDTIDEVIARGRQIDCPHR